MGKYDDIQPEDLRNDLKQFARLILRLEREELLLRSAPELQRLIGELRQKLFAYEVRGARRLKAGSEPKEEADPSLRESLRVVREALEREKRMYDEWDGTSLSDEDDDDE